MYIYIYYIYIISILKPFRNVFREKVILKTHLFIQNNILLNILRSLQKLRQYNKNLRKHQTKINKAINKN